MATLPTFRTWVAGEVVTAAFMNSNIRDAGNFFLSWPVFEGRQTVVQTIPNNVLTAILLDTEDIDLDNGHSTVTNTSRYVGKTPGRYQVSGAIAYSPNATNSRTVEIGLNGATQAGSGVLFPPAGGVYSTRLPGRTRTLFLNGTTDYFELMGLQDSGGALNTAVVNQEQSNFTVRMIGIT